MNVYAIYNLLCCYVILAKLGSYAELKLRSIPAPHFLILIVCSEQVFKSSGKVLGLWNCFSSEHLCEHITPCCRQPPYVCACLVEYSDELDFTHILTLYKHVQ